MASADKPRLSPALIAAIVLAACGAPACAQTSRSGASLKEEAPAYNDIVARSFLIDVEPLIEKHTGWDCEWPVPFRLVTRAQYVDATASEMKKRLAKDYPAMAVDQMLKPMLESQAVGLLGCYSSASKSLYLLPGNLKPLLRALGVEERHARALIEVILAHELTHAVQDSRHRISERSAKIVDDDENAAWTMLVEGHASWVAERVAEDLQLSEAAQRLAERMVSSNVSPSLRRSSQDESANYRGYTSGKRFVEQVFAKGGIKAVQALFDKPPTSTAMIENPELYFAQ